MKKKIVFFHLLNNYTGSPQVLRNVIEAARDQGYEIDLFTSKSTGFLSGIQGINYRNNFYKRYRNRFFTLFSFFLSQFCLAFHTLQYRKSNTLFYVNTILPFGSIVMGNILGKKVIAHIHEYEISPLALNNFLFSVVNRYSTKIIVVSEFLKNNTAFKREDTVVIHNCVTKEFERKAVPKERTDSRFQVLMLASLRPYKGIMEFIQLSQLLPQFDFRLVVSDTQEDLQSYIFEMSIPSNLQIFPVHTDVHSFYRNADLILNLTDKSQVIETFGLTILEGMYYGLPSIIPTVGGITELVEEGLNGYKIDSKDVKTIASKILEISENSLLKTRLYKDCLLQKEKFSRASFNQKITKILSE